MYIFSEKMLNRIPNEVIDSLGCPSEFAWALTSANQKVVTCFLANLNGTIYLPSINCRKRTLLHGIGRHVDGCRTAKRLPHWNVSQTQFPPSQCEFDPLDHFSNLYFSHQVNC